MGPGVRHGSSCADLGRPGVIEPAWFAFYLARLAGFIPALLAGTIEDAELVANGLGLTALGFLASRLLRFWLLAMSFSTAVGEFSNSDKDQVRKDRCMPPFFLWLNDGAIDYFAGVSNGRSPRSGLGAGIGAGVGAGAGVGRATSPLVFLLSFASDQAAIVAAPSSAFVMELKKSPI